ncbi:MAG: hypothetical protein HZA49_05545 [Planctomycetes bacterium]|nr:hypothetical protein [Planctomycetota bacterium]
MENEFGKCDICGGEIGPPFDRETDCLCKHCYDKTHRDRRHPLPSSIRMGDEWLLDASQWQESRQWTDDIIDKIDREQGNVDEDDNCAGVLARLPKRPLVGAGYATVKD